MGGDHNVVEGLGRAIGMAQLDLLVGRTPDAAQRDASADLATGLAEPALKTFDVGLRPAGQVLPLRPVVHRQQAMVVKKLDEGAGRELHHLKSPR